MNWYQLILLPFPQWSQSTKQFDFKRFYDRKETHKTISRNELRATLLLHNKIVNFTFEKLQNLHLVLCYQEFSWQK